MYLRKPFIVVTAIIIFLIGVSLAYFFLQDHNIKNNNVACSADALLCPDGSAVGRVSPSCEFAPCPKPASQ